jgi:two-component system CheB/CheR fusion protein
VVCVGASAGGLEAFRQFVGSIPPDSGLAFVLILHLDPTRSSLTAELAKHYTAMQVSEAEEGTRVEPNHVYVIPPNRYIGIHDGILRLTQPVEPRGLRLPIDFFLRTLAEDQQEHAIAVILSGTGTDGTLGVREIKAANGMVMVQDPTSAAHEGMSRSAISTGVVDYVLPVPGMAEALLRYAQHWYVNGVAAPPPIDERPDYLHTIIGILRARTKYDFSGYRKGTLTRRIQRRMGLSHIPDPTEYVEFLRQHPDEITALHKDLLISVTSFFRQPESWRGLEETVIGPMVRSHPDESPLRVWVPGCATGEEAYGLAMVLIEQCEAAGKRCELQVFASDIDGDALAFARAGVYPESIIEDVSTSRLRNFFHKEGHTCRVGRQLRELVLFAQQNVITDPPFSKIHLISCRNVLIYFEPDVQERVLSLFHFALREGGYLFLGSSETITRPQGLFVAHSRRFRIFRRTGPVRLERLEFPSRPAAGRAVEEVEVNPQTRRGAILAQQLMLRRFAPACAVINRRGEVLFLNGPVDRFLQVMPGEPSSDLVAMARDGLRTKLRYALERSLAEERAVTVQNLRVKGDHAAPIDVTVEPLQGPPGGLLMLVTFASASLPAPAGKTSEPPLAVAPGDGESELVIRRLEDDLQATRQDLQTTIEELQTSNEEFKAANEEAISINEELQSANEELQTSKEELQSLNEELQTVNNQLELKITELETAHNDLSNLFQSTDIATIFLDRNLRIRRFTPATQRLVRVIASDIGRPFADLVLNVDDARFMPDADRVLRSLTPIEREVRDPEGRWYLRRTVPYRTQEDHIDGVVITFTDITRPKSEQDAIRSLNEELRKRVDQRTAEVVKLIEVAADAIVVVGADGTILELNHRTVGLFGWARDELLGRPVELLIPERYAKTHADDRAGYFESPFPRPMGTGRELFGRRKDGSEIPIDVSLSTMEREGQPVAVAAIRDITERKLAEASRARLAAVVQSSSTAILVLDFDGTIRTWNAGAEKLFGHAPAEAIGRPVEMLLPAERASEFRDNVARLMRGEPVEDFETVLLHRNGTRVDVALTISAVTDAAGHSSGLCAIFTDIRPRKELEAQMAELLERERQRVGRELHDTLGQQLTAVGMLVSSLKSQAARGEEGSASLVRLEQTVEESKVQLRSIIAGVFPVTVDPERLTWALRDLAHETTRLYGLTCSFEEEGPGPVAEDGFVATQLYLIAREAVHNAVRHAQARELAIRLETGAGTRLSVSDDGQGMPENVDRMATMGLRIMRYRSGVIGGRLRIEPRPGGGTVATVEHWPSAKP